METTTRSRYGDLTLDSAEVCFTCLHVFSPDDQVETRASEVPPSPFPSQFPRMIWHASEGCATSVWVVNWLRL